MARASFPQRTITSQPKFGTIVDVDVPTYITGMLQFASGAIGTIFTTFDAYIAEVPRIEIYGSAGTLSVPDPNCFGEAGNVRLYRPEAGKFMEVPHMFPYPANSRALGLADMAKAIQSGRDFRATSKLTFHVLEVMSGILQSAKDGANVKMASAVERPALMVPATLPGYFEA